MCAQNYFFGFFPQAFLPIRKQIVVRLKLCRIPQQGDKLINNNEIDLN